MTILGTDYKDFLFGTKGADIFDGGKDADTMTGFGGNDTYYVDDAGDKVVEETNGGVDTVISSVDYHFDANVEKAILTGMAKDAFGNALDNTITGDDQNNTIFGGAGKDTMIGGKGDDFYYVDNSGDKVVETLTQAQGGGYDVVASMVGFSIANTANVEEVILQGATDISATGNAGDNWLHGNAGNNTLTGGAGDDTLLGNAGEDMLDGGTGNDKMTGGNDNDTYKVDSAGDQVIEGALGGHGDTIISSIAMTNAVANVEHYFFNIKTALDFHGSVGNEFIQGGSGNDVIHGGGGQDHLAGGAGSDQLFGGDTEDHLDGGAGADVMTGGDGGDYYYVDNKGDVVNETGNGNDQVIASISIAKLADNVEEWSAVVGKMALNGTGNDLDNKMLGNDGANIIDGGKGADNLYGYLGSDTYIVDNVGDTAYEIMDSKTDVDLVKSSVDFVLGQYIENLILTGTAVKGTGNTENNIITGNDEANYLDGKAGNDTLIGGKGDDYYVVDSLDDKIVETLTQAKGGGIDAIESSVDYSLAALGNVEMLQLTGSAIKAIGNALDNTLYGDAMGNWLDGGKGADVMAGADGNDTYVVDNAGDKIGETGGLADTHDHVISTIALTSGFANVEDYTFNTSTAVHFTGDAANNEITGGTGNDVINGNGGMDVLYGHKGNDTLTGGAGGDTFFFYTSLAGNEGHDTITDFVKAEDVLSFNTGDYNGDKSVDLNDLLDSCSVIDHGAGQAVDVTFADGGVVTFAGAGTGSVDSIDDLVANAATQIHVV